MSWAKLVRSKLEKRNLYALFLAAVVLSLYLPAVRFGLIWDDPNYYQKVSLQSSLRQIFTSPQPPTYQFYRPFAAFYGHLFLSPTGVVNAPLSPIAADKLSSSGKPASWLSSPRAARNSRTYCLSFAASDKNGIGAGSRPGRDRITLPS